MALSCQVHTAYLYERGGRKKLGQLDQLVRVRWGRKRDDPSTGSVFIASPGLECAKVLGLAETNRTELVLFRGSERVWEGPVTRISYQGKGVEIEARDVMVYAVRTIMRNEYDNRYPNNGTVLDRLARVLPAELARKEALDPPINVLPYVQYLRSGSKHYKQVYYDTKLTKSRVAEAKSLAALETAMNQIQADYGMSVGFGVPPGTEAYGMSWEPVRYQDWQLRQYLILTADALAKYPPSYIWDSNVEGIYYVRNLNMGTGFNVGGGAVDTRLYLDIVDYAHENLLVFGSEHLIHHELAHLQMNKFGAALIEARWRALNPSEFAYGGNWQAVDYPGLNPPGFIRDYGRYSFAEDLAEVAGAVMAKSMQDYLATLVSTDPVVAAKVALYKEWMEANSGGVIAGPYFAALHTGEITVAGPTGATDAGTAAHTVPYEMTLFEHIDNYAARGGIDYTVVGRSILFFDVHHRIGQTPTVTAADFIGDPIITQYGMELATYVAMTDGKGHWGDAGGTDPYYGEWEVLHQAYDENAGPVSENEPPSVAELRSQAQRSYKQGSKPPLVVRIPDNTRLNPNGVLTIAELVPGTWIPLSATLPGRTVSQMQKLDSMTVEETAAGGEVIKVVLSPAYTEQFVEETP